MLGGAGNDAYYVDNAGDVVVEVVDQGTDTVRSSVTYALRDNLEHLVLTGADPIDGTGNELNNNLYGNSGGNVLDGKDGNDYLNADSGDDTLFGGSGNDTLIGGTGADVMQGGAGNDTYFVDHAADMVVEAPGEGTDSVRSSVTYILGDHLENLTLTGMDDISGTGNALDNKIYGNTGANVLSGEGGNDYISASDKNDTLNGGDGNDTLIGGGGADIMQGGAGNDTYYVDNAGDVIVEAIDGGTDAVRSTVSYTLSDNVENLTLTGADSINGTGNDMNNNIYGNNGANVLSGRGGNDYISASGVDDVLDGGTGNDTLAGGSGNDAYIFRRTDGKDTITETAGLTGDSDTVKMIEGISKSEPVIVKQRNDLYLFVDGSNYIRVVNQFYQANYGVERLEVSDGHYVTRADIENIVNTMSVIGNNAGMDVIAKFNAMRNDQTYINTLAQSWHQPQA
jgi:Ca2+-binding RTX toxin-like protein